MKEHYFQIKYGFNSSDTVTVKGSEVEKAIYAQVKKSPVQLAEQYINGSNIIVIRPAYYMHTGWYQTYEPTTGDDFQQIARDCPKYDGIIEAYKQRVTDLIQQGRVDLIGKGNDILTIEQSTYVNPMTHDLAIKFKIT